MLETQTLHIESLAMLDLISTGIMPTEWICSASISFSGKAKPGGQVEHQRPEISTATTDRKRPRINRAPEKLSEVEDQSSTSSAPINRRSLC